MTFDILLIKQAENGYIARPVLWPESVVYGPTEKDALDGIPGLIRDLFSRTQFVQIELDVPERQVENPWLVKAGMFANDPTWDDFLNAMADYRQQLNAEAVSEPA